MCEYLLFLFFFKQKKKLPSLPGLVNGIFFFYTEIYHFRFGNELTTILRN